MKHIFENAIANVNSAYPSIYTKEDVVRLIQDIQVRVETFSAEKPTVSNDALDLIKESLLEDVKNLSIEDFVSLELNYENRIDVDVDYRGLLNEVEHAFEIAVTHVMTDTTEK